MNDNEVTYNLIAGGAPHVGGSPGECLALAAADAGVDLDEFVRAVASGEIIAFWA